MRFFKEAFLMPLGTVATRIANARSFCCHNCTLRLFQSNMNNSV